MDELILVLQHLKHPEYVHVLLNPLPVYATSMGVLALAIGLYMRSRQAQMVALIITIIGCASAFPVLKFGQRAYDKIYPISDPEAQQWLDLHMWRAETFVYLFYFTVLVAIAALVSHRVAHRFAKSFSILTLVLAIASLGLAGFISHAGGQVRHPEFRSGPPPNPVPHDHDHSHGGHEHSHGDHPSEGHDESAGHDADAQGTHEPNQSAPHEHGPEPTSEPESSHDDGHDEHVPSAKPSSQDNAPGAASKASPSAESHKHAESPKPEHSDMHTPADDSDKGEAANSGAHEGGEVHEHSPMAEPTGEPHSETSPSPPAPEHPAEETPEHDHGAGKQTEEQAHEHAHEDLEHGHANHDMETPPQAIEAAPEINVPVAVPEHKPEKTFLEEQERRYPRAH